MAQSPNQIENPRNRIAREAAESRAEQLKAELTPLEGQPPFEPAPEPDEKPGAAKAQEAAEPPKPESAPEPPTPERPEQTPEPAPSTPPSEPAVSPPPAEAQAPKSAAAGPEYVAVKVYGREMQVLKSDVDAAGGKDAYQMREAARQELEEVKRKSAELNLALAQTRQAQQAPGAAQPQSPANQDEEIARHIQLLQFGTKDEQIAAAKSISALNARPTLPIDQIVSIATDRVNQHTAITQFAKDYSDILKDEDIARMSIFRENQMLSEFNQRGQKVQDWTGFYKTIGEDLRKKFGPSNQGVNVAQRIQAKEAIVEPVEAAGKKALPQEIQPKTAADVVREIRKSRGQRVTE